MRYLFIFIYTMITLSALAQTPSREAKSHIEGSVYDAKTRESIPQASIRLLEQSDSTYIQGTVTDIDGNFKLLTSQGKYIIEISFIGYTKFHQNIELNSKQPGYNLEKVYLKEDAFMLGEAVVEAKSPDIVVKGDTIEYNAAAYTSEENAMLSDMIKNIPGIELDANGNITANGKPVQKILVDGKEFFGNDIALALANLPANMIKKLQLFKEESETAKVTGFRDKDPEQVLNLIVKEELKQSIFGDVRVGYGSGDKYANRAIVNYMRDKNQASFVGNINNVNNNDNLVSSDGVERNKNAGFNLYTQASKKFKIGGNIRYSNNENMLETKTETQTFLSSGDRTSRQDSKNENQRENFNGGMNLSWEPDSLTTIFARSYINFNNSNINQTSTSISHVAQMDTTSGYNINDSKGNGYNINNVFTIGRKLNSKGRTISLTLNHTLRKDDSKGMNYSLTSYSGEIPDNIIDQKLTTKSTTNGYAFSLSYVEPINKDHSLQFAYNYNNNHSDRDRDARKKDEEGNYTIIDKPFSRNTVNDYINQNISLNFQGTKEKYNYTLGISIDPSYSKSNISLGDSIIEDITQNVVNYSPTLHFSYRPNTTTNLDFDYSGYSRQPAINQISADTTVVNALSKYYGNPNLKPSYDNNFNFNYQKSDYETNRFMMISGSFRYTFNNIVDYTLIDAQGNSLNTYRNINGNIGSNLGFMYNTPLRNKKFTINTNTFVNYYKNKGFTNGEKAITNNIVLSEQLMVRFKSTKFETSLQGNINHSITKNNLTNAQNRVTTNYVFSNITLVKLPYDFSIQSNLDYSYFAGYGDDFQTSEMLWNASIAKLFLKQKKGSLKLQLFDILNDRNNVSRYVSGNYLSDTRTNTLNQFVMLSFSYRFNIFKGKSDNVDNDYYF